jgi:hypothetical protein
MINNLCSICGSHIVGEWRTDKRTIKNKPLLYCSRACSNKRILTVDTKRQISNSLIEKFKLGRLTTKIKRKCVDCNTIISVDSRTPETKGRCIPCREEDKRKKEALRYSNSYSTVQCLNCLSDILRSKITCHKPFCNQKCQGEYRYDHEQQKRNILFEQGKLKYRKRIRAILLERQGNICQICNNTEWNNHPIPLQVDHKDGNAANNVPSNLRMICHNCDALLPTFAGKNKGNGRKSRGLKSYE